MLPFLIPLALAAVGAGAGAAINKENRLKGALLGGTLGGTAGAMAPAALGALGIGGAGAATTTAATLPAAGSTFASSLPNYAGLASTLGNTSLSGAAATGAGASTASLGSGSGALSTLGKLKPFVEPGMQLMGSMMQGQQPEDYSYLSPVQPVPVAQLNPQLRQFPRLGGGYYNV